jgi:hypothetical protein
MLSKAKYVKKMILCLKNHSKIINKNNKTILVALKNAIATKN